jgi:hypothetical protein
MKTLGITRIGAVVLFCAQITSAMAITFTHDAFISFVDLSYEGQDIVVSNCTLTVDGPHAFNSLQVLPGGVVTHSPLPYGPQQFTFSVSGEPQVLSTMLPATLINTNVDTTSIGVMDSSGSIFYTENVDYVVTLSNQFTKLILTTNSAISEGATVLVDYNWAEEFQGFNLVISNDTKVAVGGAINVSGKGFTGGIGFLNGAGTARTTNSPFTFTAGGGGGHGGNGGMSSTFARGGAGYDAATNPGVLGSGGGMGSSVGGTGGGVVALYVGGALQVDGLLFADGLRGTNAHSGGGAGGSILVSAQTFSGTGTLSAKGGSGDLPDGGGGGGGRIGIYFSSNNFTGNIFAFGGGGSTAGGAGTIYLRSTTSSAGQLFIVNGGKRGTNTIFAPDPVTDLIISGGAVAQPQITTVSVTNLFIGSNSWLIARDALPLTMTVNGSATLESNAMIKADSESLSGAGQGSAACGAGSGGGYGGYGGTSVCGTRGGGIYGSISQPSNLGSPGGLGSSGRGGGAITMTVGGTLMLAGKISANGGGATVPVNGGGSGGSIWLTVGTLLGGGAISANGGAASNLVSGGGSGGRIAVYFDTNFFTGSITARGGMGTNGGGPGTVYLKSGSDPVAQLIVDNGGIIGTTALPAALPVSDLTISGGAVLTNYFASAINLRSLFIGSNSWLTPAFQSSLIGTVTNATLQPGGGITADGKFTSSSLGGGQSANLSGGGGGNAGNGGASATNAAGGIGSVSYSLPTASGGVGGMGTGLGGFGGGIINLTMPGRLQLDGQISANGTTGVGLNSGGGAGGSIRLAARTISGAGIISASGGGANNLGGGGGGGAIALYSDTNLFSGSMTSTGGSGANYGGAGTVYVSQSSVFGLAARLTLDNGGNQGAKTPLGLGGDIDNLTVIGGTAISNLFASVSQLKSLLVGSNSSIQIAQNPLLTLNITSNATILAGGSINADGGNSGFGPGLGQTLNSTGGGGGSAGSGGASLLNATGGPPISDSLSAPATSGGRGGGGGNQGFGGNGGSGFRLNVSGTLRVDGRISAEGLTSPSLDSGGGGGGSLSLSAKTLSGSGVISANGGAANSAGGGGGGGHVAISCTSNLFTGSVTARGGSGANIGGAGLIYLTGGPSTAQILSQIILDNGGTRGGYTPLFTSLQGNFNLTVTGGAILTNSIGSTIQNLLIGSNSTWMASSTSPFILTVQTNATILAGGSLTADGIIFGGPSPGQTPGSRGGGGGGHGGYGGTSISNALGGNITQDSLTAPIGLGSSGGAQGGNGGGALQLTVRGALQLDGKLSANGVTSAVATSGGGSGGSISLFVGKLSGTGLISANGGAGNNLGGGGGGGRIAISYNTNLFTGAVTARGGAGANFGGAGTIYTTSSFFGEGKSSQLIVDNGGNRGTNTLISSLVASGDLVLGSGAAVTLSSSATRWNSLTISSNASLALDPSIKSIVLTITSNLTIQPGGSFTLDGQGFSANTGVGSGSSFLGVGSGAGHGGYGSQGTQTAAAGGISYDSITSPIQAGSGGGSVPTTSGSAGGGALRLTVNGILAVNGTISANGKPGTTAGTGGGSGGSLWLSAGTFLGNGKISANGGDGELFGGGGGGAGGRIATTFNSNQFTGTFSARGGAGPFLYGGAGTIYSKTNSSSVGQLVLDNSGMPGTNTPLSSLGSTIALSVFSGAAANATGPFTVQNLVIDSGGLFNANSAIPLNLTVLGNALVQTNGAIALDGAGYDPTSGFANAAVDFFGDGSGGGYGGVGGASLFGAPGGGTYGSSNQPMDLGSAGGTFPVLAGYSRGGGAVHLTVDGSLTLNGNVSANGNDGYLDGSGGGSGGSIWITANTLSGNGSLSANGGMGESYEGGGGGGGRIAIYTGTNLFAGNISALGGDGAYPGANGTIYIPISFLISGSITNLSGQAMPGVPITASGSGPFNTDANGLYSLTVSPVWTGAIQAAGNPFALPTARVYPSLASDTPDQNFLLISPADLNMTSGEFDGTNVNFNWYGISGLSYQPCYSSNLVDWQPYGPVMPGSNGPASLSWPTTNAPQLFFRLSVTY